MTESRKLAEEDPAEVAALVARLREEQGCRTRRLSRGGHEFVLAGHAPDTATAHDTGTELVWVAGDRTVTASHVDRLHTSTDSLDADHACVVTVGDGRIEASSDGVAHLAGDELGRLLDEDRTDETPGASTDSSGRSESSPSDTAAGNDGPWDGSTTGATGGTPALWDASTTSAGELLDQARRAREGVDGVTSGRSDRPD